MPRDAQPRSRTRQARLIGAALIALIAVVAAGYFLGSNAVPSNSQYLAARDAPPAGIDADNGAIPTFAGPPASATPAADATPPPGAENPDRADAADHGTLDGSVVGSGDDGAGDSDAPPPPPADEPDADRQGHAEIAAAVRDATLEALDEGGTVHWHKDGLSGDAVAGAARLDGERSCRGVYVTTERADSLSRSATATWCKDGDEGEWRRQ